MKTSLYARSVALFASILVTFTVVDVIAGYALPDVAPVLLASAAD